MDASEKRPTLVLVTADLFLGSRLRAIGEQCGYRVMTVARADAWQADKKPERILIDLTAPGLDVAAVVDRFDSESLAAYAPHVRVDLLKAARAAGLTTVLTRSQLESHLPGWLASEMG